jgi:hypothetical protein
VRRRRYGHARIDNGKSRYRNVGITESQFPVSVFRDVHVFIAVGASLRMLR